MRNSKTISQLLFKYLQGNLTPEESETLNNWRLESAEHQLFFEKLSKEAVRAKALASSDEDRTALEQSIFNKIVERVPELQRTAVPMRTRWWKYVAAAAAIILVINVALLMKQDTQQERVALHKKMDKQDVPAPQDTYASITLADGEKVSLNSTESGTLASQGKIQVVKSEDGLIVYKTSRGKAGGEMQFNTLTNPKGSKVIGLVLEDGTKVWLNAESSLTYPVAFVGQERKVAITGEAYFEVTKNKAMPFKISRGEMQIEVLGTSFNVNAYANEPEMKVTLLEGAVKVSSGDATGVLRPGQQAKIKDRDINVYANVNLDQVMAWKNGYFSFEKAHVTLVMREIARWYNVEVAYEGQIPDENFGGELRRNSSLASVLKVLEKSGVKFRIEGNKVTVFR